MTTVAMCLAMSINFRIKEKRVSDPPLVFSQRNNPYCELLQTDAKVCFFLEKQSLFKKILYLLAVNLLNKRHFLVKQDFK